MARRKCAILRIWWRTIWEGRILISMVVVTAIAILVQLSSLSSSPKEPIKSNVSCEMGPFKEGIIECLRYQQRQDNLCPMEILGWVTSDGKLDVMKIIGDIESHMINPKYEKRIKEMYIGCIEAANAHGKSQDAVADWFIGCWAKNRGSELSKKAFCSE